MNLLLCAALLHAPAAGPDAWPGFRNAGDGVSPSAALPVEWSEKDIAWKADLPGYGQSNPVVWGGRVFVTAVEGDQREKGYVVALDARTGKELWRHAFEPTQKAKWSYTVARAAPTPAVDSKYVYAFFEGGDLLAFTHDGRQAWARSTAKEFGPTQGGHGLGASPVQSDDALFVLVDDRGPSYLLAVEKATGKTLWKVDRPSKGSWATPVVVKQKGRTQVVVSSNGTVVGYDAADGKQLWELAGLGGNTLPSASASGDTVLVGAGAPRGPEAKPTDPSNLCLKLVEKDGKAGYEVAWRAEKATASYASPLSHKGNAYFVNAVGVVYCIDGATGKELYAERIDGPCWASPIAAGDRVYFFGKDGRTTVVKAGGEFEKVATNRLWDPASVKKSGEYGDPIVYGAAAADGAFFLRTGNALFRVGKP